MEESEALVWIVGMLGVFVAGMLACLAVLTYHASRMFHRLGYDLRDVLREMQEAAHAK